jgi:host factor-I protein
MDKPKINFQDQFLNIARRERLKVELELVSGGKVQGFIKSFDNFCLLVEEDDGGEQLIYKHGTTRVILLDKPREKKE